MKKEIEKKIINEMNLELIEFTICKLKIILQKISEKYNLEYEDLYTKYIKKLENFIKNNNV